MKPPEIIKEEEETTEIAAYSPKQESIDRPELERVLEIIAEEDKKLEAEIMNETPQIEYEVTPKENEAVEDEQIEPETINTKDEAIIDITQTSEQELEEKQIESEATTTEGEMIIDTVQKPEQEEEKQIESETTTTEDEAIIETVQEPKQEEEKQDEPTTIEGEITDTAQTLKQEPKEEQNVPIITKDETAIDIIQPLKQEPDREPEPEELQEMVESIKEMLEVSPPKPKMLVDRVFNEIYCIQDGIIEAMEEDEKYKKELDEIKDRLDIRYVEEGKNRYDYLYWNFNNIMKKVSNNYGRSLKQRKRWMKYFMINDAYDQKVYRPKVISDEEAKS
jgi:hypothetical protein